MKFVHSGTCYPIDRLGIQFSDSSLSIQQTNCIDDFINRLVEEEETFLSERDPVISTSMLLQLEYELKWLPFMERIRFDGNRCK